MVRRVVSWFFWVTLALVGCFSASPLGENVCRRCTSSCPRGLVCSDGRCLPACALGCAAGTQCVDDACLPESGDPMCPEAVVSWNLCVGRAVMLPLSQALGHAPEEWVALESHLPDGLTLDVEAGEVRGTPHAAATGSLWLREGGPGEPELTIEVNAVESCAGIVPQRIEWCAGERQSAVLRATDGSSGYSWRVSGLPAGVRLIGAQLAGVVDEPATYPLSVTLLDGQLVRDEGQVELVVDGCDAPPPVRPTPPPDPVADGGLGAQSRPEDAQSPKRSPPPPEPLSIITSGLPTACVGQPYASGSLQASGGFGAYGWSLIAGPQWLSVDPVTGTLTGTPDRPEPFEAIVQLGDGAGAKSEGRLSGTVDAAGAGNCARAPLGITTAELPEACIGEEYYARLEAAGGGGNYVWRAFGEPPAGLTLELDGVVRGIVPASTPLGPTRLTVRLASSLADQPITASVSLGVAACNMLAFIAGDSGVDRLFVAAHPLVEVREASRELLAAGERVRSLLFSPTARTFAFLVDSPDGPGPARVYLADGFEGLPRLVEWPSVSATEISVIEYVWSASGAQLALVARAGDSIFLGTVSPGSSQVTAAVDVTERYLGSLFWANERPCYKAPAERTRQRNVLCHEIVGGEVADDGLVSGLFLASELEGATLFGGAEGYLAVLPDRLQAYYRDLRSGLSFKHLEHVFSPSLRWAAGVAPGATGPQLRTSAPERDTQEPRVLAEIEGCDARHAWSADDSRIACKTGGELRIIELGAEGRALRSSVVLDSSGYPDGEFRRLFAPDGRWYAYDAGAELRIVDTENEAPVSQVVGDHAGQGLYVGLATDASGTALFYHHGSQLDVVHPAAGPSPLNLSGGVLLSEPLPCSSNYLVAGPGLWCGASRLPGSFFPSRNGRSVAFLDTEGRLHVIASGSGETRRVLELPVNCMDDANEIRCDERVQWAPR